MKDQVYGERVFFNGHVQGVGFRYMTLQIAKEFEVAGWVRNLADGRVELNCEGEKVEVCRFIDEVCDRLESYIRKVERDGGLKDRTEKGFRIR